MATTKKKPASTAAAKKSTSSSKKTSSPTKKKAASSSKTASKKSTSAARQKTTPTTKKTTTTVTHRTTTRPSSLPSVPTSKAKTSQWQGVASLVLAICALVFCWVPVFNFILAILALIFGIMALKTTRKGMGIAGIIISAFTLIVIALITLVLTAAFKFTSDQIKKSDNLDRIEQSITDVETGFNSTLGKITTDLILNTTNTVNSDLEFLANNTFQDQETLSIAAPDSEYFAFKSPDEVLVVQAYIYEDDIDTVFDPDFDTVVDKVPANIAKAVRSVATVFEKYTPHTFVDPAQAILATSANDINDADASYITREDGYAQYTDNSVDGTKTLFVIFDVNDEVVAAGYTDFEEWD